MTDRPEQLGSAALKKMSADQILKAQKEGALEDLLAGIDPDAVDRRAEIEQARARLRQMAPEQVAAATRNGSLDGILGRNS